MYEHGTYTFMNVNICMDVVQTSCTASQKHFTSHQARSGLHCQRVSAPLRLCSFRAASFLSSVFLTDSTTQEWLAHPNCHSHVFTSYILLQCWPSAAAVSQLPRGKPELLCWLKIISLHLWTETAPIPILNCKKEYPSVLLLHLCVGHENLLEQEVKTCMLHCIYMYIQCIYMYIRSTYVVHGYHILYV